MSIGTGFESFSEYLSQLSPLQVTATTPLRCHPYLPSASFSLLCVISQKQMNFWLPFTLLLVINLKRYAKYSLTVCTTCTNLDEALY